MRKMRNMGKLPELDEKKKKVKGKDWVDMSAGEKAVGAAKACARALSGGLLFKKKS